MGPSAAAVCVSVVALVPLASALDCASFDSEDCLLEYNNAVANGDMNPFYTRCAGELGIEPLRSRCSLCCDSPEVPVDPEAFCCFWAEGGVEGACDACIAKSEPGDFCSNREACLGACQPDQADHMPAVFCPGGGGVVPTGLPSALPTTIAPVSAPTSVAPKPTKKPRARPTAAPVAKPVPAPTLAPTSVAPPTADKDGWCCYYSPEEDMCGDCHEVSVDGQYCAKDKYTCEVECADNPEYPKKWCNGPMPAPKPTPNPERTPGFCCYYSSMESTGDWCGHCEDKSDDSEHCGANKNTCENECVGTDTKVWCPA